MNFYNQYTIEPDMHDAWFLFTHTTCGTWIRDSSDSYAWGIASLDELMRAADKHQRECK